MSNYFTDNKEQITCTGGSLDGRNLWITKGLESFVVLGHGGNKESYAKGDDGRFAFVRDVRNNTDRYMPCSQ